MTRCSVQPKERIFVKSYWFSSFATNIGKNIGKNININLSGKYNQKLLDHFKQSAADAFITASKTVIQNTAEATCDLIDNKITAKVAKVSQNL